MRLPSADEVRASIAADELREFIRMAWPIVEPAVYMHHWLIDAICDHLEAATRREIRRLIINIPPRTIKTRSVSVMWPAWVWLTQPEIRWMFASYSSDLSTEASVDCRAVIESKGGREDGGTLMERVGYQGLLSLLGQDWTIADDQNLKTRYRNSAGGYRLATSVGAKVTGFGADIIVADDPHNVKEAESELVRQGVLDWWDRAISSRMNDPKTGVRVVVMQRINEQDLTGHLLAKEAGYEHLCLPMEYEPAHPFVWPDDPRVTEGEKLWPERFDDPVLDQFRLDMGSYAYAGQYQQRPAPAEGGIFKRAWWRFYPEGEPPQLKRTWTTWDTALKEKTASDYTVGIAWGQDLSNVYVLRIVRGRWSLVEALAQMQALHDWIEAEHPHSGMPTHYVENTAMGPELMAAARRRIKGIVSLRASIDKVARAEAVTPALEAGNVWLPAHPVTLEPTNAADLLIEECSAFPNGAHDDQVDALVYGIDPRRWSDGAKRPNRERRSRPLTAGITAGDR